MTRNPGFVSILVGAAFLLLPAVSFAAGPVCTVPGTYATIQAAASDVGCTAINVAAGTYTEMVAVNNPTTIVGASGANLTGEFDINVASTSISGFSITNPSGGFGVLINGVGKVIVSGNTISSIGTTGTGNKYGVWFQSSGSTPVSNIAIQNNIISNIGNASNPFTSGGIGIGDSGSTQNIIGGLVISGNTISSVLSSTRGAYGVLINLGSGANTASVTGAVINNNSISGLTSTSGWVHAIGVEANAPSININHNTIATLTSGGSPALAVWFENEDTSFSSALVNRNSLDVGSASYGIAVYPTLSGSPLNGTCNWWGAANGPGSIGSGSGSLVTASTTFNPWLTTNNLDGSCTGGTTGHLIVDKVTNPSGDPTSFGFTTTGTGYTPFNLADATTPNNQTLTAGDYSVIESATNGWTLSGAVCSDNGSTGGPYTPGSTLTLQAGHTITCTFTNTKNAVAQPQVHIFKYIDGVPASTTPVTAVFPMETTFNSSNLGIATNVPFTLSPTGWGAADQPYEASFVGSNAGANYEADEVLTTPVVGATCDGNHTYTLGGYSTGDTLAHAFANASSTVAPSFTNLQSDKYVIVWNKTCHVPPVCNINATQTLVSDITTQDVTDGHAAVAVTPHPAWVTLLGSTWIYSDALNANGSSPTGTKTFSKTFTIVGTPSDSSLTIAADNMYTVMVNGHLINTGTSGTDLNNFSSTATWTIPAADLLTGSNTITFTVTNPANDPSTGAPFGDPNPAGLLYKLNLNNNECVTPPPPGTGSISGYKFEDWDGDGSNFETQWEIGLAGWTIYIDTNNNGHLDVGEPSTITNSNGKYTFTGLSAGTYHVREVQQAGWMQTYPASGVQNVTLTTGQSAKNKNFGNFKLGTISGMKFNDLNANHHKDSGEPGLAGWTINLKGPHGFASTTVTDAAGKYSFSKLGPGAYTLSEVMQPTWRQTLHPGTVHINSDSAVTTKNFGNTQKVKAKTDHDNDNDFSD